MKNEKEVCALFTLMYILNEYEVEQEVQDRVKQLAISASEHLEDSDASVEDVMQEAIKVLEEFVKSKGVK